MMNNGTRNKEIFIMDLQMVLGIIVQEVIINIETTNHEKENQCIYKKKIIRIYQNILKSKILYIKFFLTIKNKDREFIMQKINRLLNLKNFIIYFYIFIYKEYEIENII